MLLTLDNIDTLELRDRAKCYSPLKALLKAGYTPFCIGSGVLYNRPDEWIYSGYIQSNIWVNILTGAYSLFGTSHVGWQGWKSIHRPTHELEEGWNKLQKAFLVETRPHKWETCSHDTEKTTYYYYQCIVDATTNTFVTAKEQQKNILTKFFNPDFAGVALAGGIAGGGLGCQVLLGTKD